MTHTPVSTDYGVDPDDQTVPYADYGDDGDDDTCPLCHGDGGDPYCDRILPCPRCGGTGSTW